MKNISIFFAALFCTGLLAQSHLSLNFEFGGVWQHRNDFQISPESGSRINLDDYNHGPFTHYRIESHWRLAPKHAIRILYAPFRVSFAKRTDKIENFDGVTFDGSKPITFVYQFNSYRLGYVYNIFAGQKHMLDLGLTAKIRDAEIALSQDNVNQSYDNIGFVPLFYFGYRYIINGSTYLDINSDFAYAPQGRATDLAIKLKHRLGQANTLGVGVRSIEGGAANDKVYTFSWFNYLVADWTIAI